jgi:ClpP class serine protease
VGSIGVVTAGFGLNGLLERFGVERRVYTAGAHKVRLDPFQQEKDEDVEWLKGLQAQLHEQFVGWVKTRRGDRLADGEDLFTGEVWTGAKAKELGLIDGVGSLRTVLSERYPDAEITVAEPKRPLLARLGIGGAAQSLLTAVEHRAIWSRYGL